MALGKSRERSMEKSSEWSMRKTGPDSQATQQLKDRAAMIALHKLLDTIEFQRRLRLVELNHDIRITKKRYSKHIERAKLLKRDKTSSEKLRTRSCRTNKTSSSKVLSPGDKSTSQLPEGLPLLPSNGVYLHSKCQERPRTQPGRARDFRLSGEVERPKTVRSEPSKKTPRSLLTEENDNKLERKHSDNDIEPMKSSFKSRITSSKSHPGVMEKSNASDKSNVLETRSSSARSKTYTVHSV